MDEDINECLNKLKNVCEQKDIVIDALNKENDILASVVEKLRLQNKQLLIEMNDIINRHKKYYEHELLSQKKHI